MLSDKAASFACLFRKPFEPLTEKLSRGFFVECLRTGALLPPIPLPCSLHCMLPLTPDIACHAGKPLATGPYRLGSSAAGHTTSQSQEGSSELRVAQSACTTGHGCPRWAPAEAEVASVHTSIPTMSSLANQSRSRHRQSACGGDISTEHRSRKASIRDI